MNDFYDWDDCTKQHIFDKDAVNSDNPAFLWGSDQLVEARAENERLTARLEAIKTIWLFAKDGENLDLAELLDLGEVTSEC